MSTPVIGMCSTSSESTSIIIFEENLRWWIDFSICFGSFDMDDANKSNAKYKKRTIFFEPSDAIKIL